MTTELPLEKQLTLESFKLMVRDMSPDQTKAVLIELFEQHLITVTLYTELVGKLMLKDLPTLPPH
jgi:hypothetical protein